MILLYALCAGAYLVAGVIVDIILELAMIHFGLGTGFTDTGRIIVYLVWPVLFVLFIGSIFFGTINTFVKMILNKRDK